MNEAVLKNKITKYLTSILESKNINYVELEKRLKEQGINENQKNLSKKINKGTFSFLFLAQVLKVIDENTIEFCISSNEYKQFSKDEYLSQDEFVSKYLELVTLFNNTSENDKKILIEIDNVEKLLLSRIGISASLFDDIDSLYKEKSLTRSQVIAFYNLVLAKNDLFDKINSLKGNVLKV